MAKQKEAMTLGRKLLVSAGLLFALLVIATFTALVFGGDFDDVSGNTAVISIEGPITASDSADAFGGAVASSTDIVLLLEEARDDSKIKAVMLEINSPGGSAVASDEIAQAVHDVRRSGKPVVAVIREVGASGAYWVASASDHVVANRMSITGSIGVISSYFEFAEFLGEWNVTYRRLVSGESKDIGDPFQPLTPSERAFLEQKLETVHGFFIEEVGRNRNLTREQVVPLADGRFFLGVEAQEAGLIDELGGKAEAVHYLEEAIGEEVTTVAFEHEEGLLDILLGTFRQGSPADAMLQRRAPRITT